MSLFIDSIRSKHWMNPPNIVEKCLNETGTDWLLVIDIATRRKCHSQVLVAEQKLLEGATSLSDSKIMAIRRKGVRARIQLRMYSEALASIADYESQYGATNSTVSQKASVLHALHRFSEAFELHERLFLTGSTKSFHKLVHNAKRAGSHECLSDFVAKCTSSNTKLSNSERIILEAFQIELTTGDHFAACSQMKQNFSSFGPEELILYAMPLALKTRDISFATRIGNLVKTEIMCSKFDDEALLLLFLRTYLRLTDEVSPFEELFDQLKPFEDIGDGVIAINRIRVLKQLKLFADARVLVESYLTKFPEHLPIWTEYCDVLIHHKDYDGLHKAKNYLKWLLPNPAYRSFLFTLGKRCWSKEELMSLIPFAVSLPVGLAQANFFLSIDKIDRELAPFNDVFTKMDAPEKVIARLWLGRLASKSSAHRALTEGSSGCTSVEDAEAESLKAYRSAIRSIGANFNQENRSDLKTFWLAKRLNDFTTTEDHFDEKFTFTNESRADAVSLAERIAAIIERKEPSSVIRLGDGEGHFMKQPSVIGDAQHSDRDHRQRKWWGDVYIKGSKGAQVLSDFRRAVKSSDIIGVIPSWRILLEAMRGQQFRLAARGIEAMLAAATEIDPRGKVLTSANLHQDLDFWGLWPRIFEQVRCVSWISCHNLEYPLNGMHSVKTRTGIIIPADQAFKAQFAKATPTEAPMAAALYDLHDEVIKEILPESGEIWLIAAGFLGKIYCDVVRQRGGIAIDIGSLADYWLGHKTRVYNVN